MALVLRTVFDVNEAMNRVAFPRDYVPVRTAHTKLAEWRARHTLPVGENTDVPAHFHGYSREYEDITDDEFDWRGYVCNRAPELVREVVGPGVGRVELRFLATYDWNLMQNRCDFVLFRVDGSGVRLHPSSKKDAVPVIAVNPAVWFIGGGAVGPIGEVGWANPDAPQGQVFREVSQHDHVSQKEAQAFLLRKVMRAEENHWRFGEFTQDITDQRTFPWIAYIAGFRQDVGIALLRREVTKVMVVWQGRPYHRAAFYIETADGGRYLHSPDAKDMLDAAAIDSIYWHA